MFGVPKFEDNIEDWMEAELAKVWRSYGLDTVGKLCAAFVSKKFPKKITGECLAAGVDLARAHIAGVSIEMYCEPKELPSNFTATKESAGSAEKIEVFRKRLENGLPLFHSQDALPFVDFTKKRAKK